MAESGTVQPLIGNAAAVDEALRRAAAAARREYLRAGLSMPVWRGGRLAWVTPEDLKQYDIQSRIEVADGCRVDA